VGGEAASKSEFPWLVALVEARTRQPFCGGSLINDRIVLTAGHCFKGTSTLYILCKTLHTTPSRNSQTLQNGVCENLQISPCYVRKFAHFAKLCENLQISPNAVCENFHTLPNAVCENLHALPNAVCENSRPLPINHVQKFASFANKSCAKIRKLCKLFAKIRVIFPTLCINSRLIVIQETLQNLPNDIIRVSANDSCAFLQAASWTFTTSRCW
jgi:hypothetical protein